MEKQRYSVLKNKRIVLAVGSLDMGGAERQLLLLAEYLRHQMQCQVTVAGIGEPAELAEACEVKSIDWVSLPIPLDKKAGIASNVRNLARFRCHLSRLKPEIIMSYTFLMNAACALVWRLCSAKACIWNQRDAGLGLEQSRWHFLPRLSSFCVSNSRHAAQMLERNSVPARKITVIHNGVAGCQTAERMGTIRAEMGLDADSKIVCMIGNIHPLKDHITLIKAWKIVVAKCAIYKPILLLAGREYDSTALRQHISEYGLSGSVRVLGHIRNINELLEAVDVGCFSSHTEGFPNGVLELMAMGLPVAATDLPGVREIIGMDPLQLARPGDYEDMAQKIIRLIGDKNVSRQIGEKNFFKVRHHFSVETMCQSYVDLLLRVCK